ncbi:hypothetical protein [Floridanema evergladense]|uniref:Uncharacterized protein n=1 Tax=Floridaenema evergladense BLCC-F167 TaxID=3153639 RepID=A0ABV4WTN2_9CYAN
MTKKQGRKRRKVEILGSAIGLRIATRSPLIFGRFSVVRSPLIPSSLISMSQLSKQPSTQQPDKH